MVSNVPACEHAFGCSRQSCTQANDGQTPFVRTADYAFDQTLKLVPQAVLGLISW